MGSIVTDSAGVKAPLARLRNEVLRGVKKWHLRKSWSILNVTIYLQVNVLSNRSKLRTYRQRAHFCDVLKVVLELCHPDNPVAVAFLFLLWVVILLIEVVHLHCLVDAAPSGFWTAAVLATTLVVQGSITIPFTKWSQMFGVWLLLMKVCQLRLINVDYIKIKLRSWNIMKN